MLGTWVDGTSSPQPDAESALKHSPIIVSLDNSSSPESWKEDIVFLFFSDGEIDLTGNK